LVSTGSARWARLDGLELVAEYEEKLGRAAAGDLGAVAIRAELEATRSTPASSAAAAIARSSRSTRSTPASSAGGDPAADLEDVVFANWLRALPGWDQARLWRATTTPGRYLVWGRERR
jgi:hypothetical protein